MNGKAIGLLGESDMIVLCLISLFIIFGVLFEVRRVESTCLSVINI